MAWLNTPELIIEDEHVYNEEQSYFSVPTGPGGGVNYYVRRRQISVTRERWVGCDYTAANAKKTALAADSAYSDVHANATGGGHYAVVAVRTVTGKWSEWAYEIYNPDE